MTFLIDVLKHIVAPGAMEKKSAPPDAAAFQESRARMNDSTKRLTDALGNDVLGAMVGRMRHPPKKKRNGR